MRGDRLFALVTVAVFGLGALLDAWVLRVPAGLLLVFLLPGRLLLRRVALTRWYRLVLAVGVSFALGVLSLLVFELFGVRATSTVVGWSLAAVTTALAVLPAAPPSFTLSSVPWPSRGVLASAALTLALAGTAWGVSVATDRAAAAAPLTQVGLVPAPGQARAFVASVTNREGRTVTYRVVVSAPEEALREVPVTLADGETWRTGLTVRDKGTLEVTVYGGSSQTPASHRSVRAVVL